MESFGVVNVSCTIFNNYGSSLLFIGLNPVMTMFVAINFSKYNSNLESDN